MTSSNVKKFLSYFFCFFWNSFFCYVPSFHIRYLVLKYIYRADIGDCSIHSGVKFFAPWKLKIGNGTNVQYGSFIDCRGGLIIEDNVDITLGVRILTQDHDVSSEEYVTRNRPVHICSNAVIGSFSLILPGVVVEEAAVVGAGSVVTKSVAKQVICGGNPARPLRNRDINNIRYKCSYKRPFH
ncbi:hypothetical protein KW505_20155 [Vibrio fluvialis]|nr:hypothetical protein [Vibrio fluvialis]